ncbi:MAG: N-acetyltransferase [Verrucomicrobiaceae bacterium]|nr:N-acetyltransferase [Verrucomicrobiaceae bacterium]
MIWIDCGREHSEAIRAIFNDAIVNSTALYDYRPRTPEVMEAWFATKEAAKLPVIGALDENGDLMGFGSYGPFRPHAAYKYSVEHSIYVDARFRGRGLGKQLLQRLIGRATEQGYHMMIGVIDAQNAASMALHQRAGFEDCGSIRHAGYKFGRWLDLALYQLVLPTPEQPVEE